MNERQFKRNVIRGMLDFLTLKLINACVIVHGYGIQTKLRKEFGCYYSPSTIYPTLEKLEQNGFLESHWNLEGERPKKDYATTERGKRLLTDMTEMMRDLKIDQCI